MADNSGLGSVVQTKAASLKNLFSKDRRFETIGLIANGSYGFTIRVRIKDPALPALTNIVVKHVNGSRGARANLVVERGHLETLQGNLHIVRLIDIPNNPLSGRVDRRDWIILEWLEHGELRSFIMKARLLLGRGTRLPNRLLWRFYICLVRCCIAMAWPNSGEEVQRGVGLSGIVHGDLHQGNSILITQAICGGSHANVSTVLLGEPPDDDEHRITPILKLIDFGGTEQYPPIEDADNQNVYDIGQIMLGLINLNRGRDAASSDAFYTWGSRKYRTEATALIPTPAGADHALCTIVCACMAENTSNRPSLSTLLRLGLQGLNETTPKPRDDDDDDDDDGSPEEQDDFISHMWRSIVYNAPIEEDDLTEDWTTSAPSTAIPSTVGSPSTAGSPSQRRPSQIATPPGSPAQRPTPPGTPVKQYPLIKTLFSSPKTPVGPKRHPKVDSAGIDWE